MNLELKSIFGGIYKFSEWVMRLSVINILWLLFSLPFVFFMMIFLFNPVIEKNQLNFLLFLTSIIAPFTLFPSTAAMFAVARKWVTGNDGVRLFKTFIRGYKQNFFQSMVGGFIFIIIGWIFYLNYTFYLKQVSMFQSFFLLIVIFFIVLVSMLFHFFSIIVHVHMGILQILKFTVGLSLGRPLETIIMLVINLFLLLFSLRFTFVIPFFMGSIIAFVTFWQFHRVYQIIKIKHA